MLAGLAIRVQVSYQKVGNNPTTINSNAVESTSKAFFHTDIKKNRSSGKGSKNRDNAFFLNKMVYKNVD